MTGGQSRRRSLAEACANVVLGYAIAVGTNAVVLPWFGVALPLSDNLRIGACFTVVSLVRSYALRRAFNAWRAR